MTGDDILEGLAVVMAHPDDEVLWAGSVLKAAEKVIVVYGEWPGADIISAGRRAAMAEFPLPTLDWVQIRETGVFDSASWPEVRETEYGLYPHRALAILDNFNPDQYRAQFDTQREALRPRLAGIRNVIAHGPWGEYGHEEHVQLFRVVASLAAEMGFRLWVPAYFAPKSEALMRRNLKYCGRPTRPFPIDQDFAQGIAQLYKRTKCWTWFDSYVWPETERFLPWYADGAPAGEAARPEEIARIRLPAEFEANPRPWEGRKRRMKRLALSWWNGRKAG